MTDKYKEIASLSELFLLLPEHKRIILNQSRNIGVEGEDKSLKKGISRLTIAAVLYTIWWIGLELVLPFAQHRTYQPTIMTIVGFFPALALVVLLYFTTRRYECKVRIENEGILVPGKILSVKTDKALTSIGIKVALRLTYEFVSPLTSKTLSKEEAQLRDDISINNLPPRGTPVAIMYVDDQCFRVL